MAKAEFDDSLKIGGCRNWGPFSMRTRLSLILSPNSIILSLVDPAYYALIRCDVGGARHARHTGYL